MTLRTNARVAGVTFLAYIVFGILEMVVFGRATAAKGVAAKLATIAQHAPDIRITVVLSLLCGLCALVLGVTLYAITREVDRDLALLALTCRLVEGVTGALSMRRPLSLLWLATAAGADAPGPEGARTLGAYLLGQGGSGIAGIFFAVASTIFCCLLLRGRMIPVPMAWLGVVASVLVVVLLPLDLVGLVESFGDLAGWLIWMPMLAFELSFAFWLIVKGVAPPMGRQSAPAAAAS